MSYDLFDIVAKVPTNTTPATADILLQSLLLERFGLVVRRDTRPVPRYIMTVGKGGSKLKSAAATPGCNPLSQPGPPPADLAATPNVKMGCCNLTSAAIAENLRQMAAAISIMIWSTPRSSTDPGTSISNGPRAARSPPKARTASRSLTLSKSGSI